MTAKNPPSIRFSWLTALVWLLVAAGIIFLLWNVIGRLSSRNLPLSTATPNLTQVYQTIAVMLNGEDTSPSPTLPRTGTPKPTSRSTERESTPLPDSKTTLTPAGVEQTATPSTPCDSASAGNPIDITIPDDSLISPGESFIKTWRLVNTGTCTWTPEYAASFFYGDRMGAPKMVSLQEDIAPSENVEISIEMVAPQQPGTYQGNWMLSNPGGELFGIGPNADAPFWVRIIVEEDQPDIPTATMSPTTTATINPTVTITATATPQGAASGVLTAIPGDALDLDSITLDSENKDLLYQVDADSFHWLIPQDGAVIGVYGSQEPIPSDCESASMSPAPLAVESLSVGTYLCYTTGEGRLGRLLLQAIDPDNFSLTLDLLTWNSS